MVKETGKTSRVVDGRTNLLFDASFEGAIAGEAPHQTWHRVGAYLPDPTPWRTVTEDAFDGRQCLKTQEKGTVVLQREIADRADGSYAFSAYLKAARPGHRVRLWVRTYRPGRGQERLFVTDEVDRIVTVGGEWTRYVLMLDVPPLRNRSVLGPVDLGVESLADGDLWLDAVQFEQGDGPTPFVCGDSGYGRMAGLRKPLYKPVEDPPDPDAPGCEQEGSISLASVQLPVGGVRQGWPMVGTVTLSEGQSYDLETWSLRSEQGAVLPSQQRVLARWKGDGSIKAVQVVFEYDGSRAWGIAHGAKREPFAWTDGIEAKSRGDGVQVRSPSLALEVDGESGLRIGPLGESHFFTETVDGCRFLSARDREASLRLEEMGPARAVVRMEGDHRDEDGRHLLSYVGRVNLFRGQPLVRLEYTWINTGASPSVPVGAIGWRVPFGERKAERAVFVGAEGRRHEVDLSEGAVSIVQLNSDGRYFYEISAEDRNPERFEGKAEGEVRVELGEDVLCMRLCDWWQNHPLGLRIDAKGMDVYFWPPRVKGVDLTCGMAKTYIVDLWLGPREEAPDVLGGPLHLAPPPSVHCRSGLFGGEMLPQSESPFPLFERIAGSDGCLGKMAPSFLEEHDLYGQFNYGDTLGDGGWGNLETELDHSVWMHYIRTGGPRLFEVAQASARHYRDIDIDQIGGSTITHNPSHTLGGKSTSHAWIQGMLDHYMATGERRSMEVALLHIDHLKGLTHEALTGGGRTVTRVLDNLADLYMLTGDDDLIARYREICDFQELEIVNDFSSFAGLFQDRVPGGPERRWRYPGLFMPWYGLYSLAKLWLATGQDEWKDFLAKETGYAMATRPFEHGRPEYFRDNPLTADQQIVRCLAEGQIGDRGSVLFPALGYAYRATGDRRYLDIGMTTVYIAMICGECHDPMYVMAGLFLEQARQAGFGEADEERCYQEAVDVMVGMAHPSLANPGFEEGMKGWSAWRVKMTTAPGWVATRQMLLEVDREEKREGRQSLHMMIPAVMPLLARGIPLESDDFLLEAGRTYRLSGWAKLKGEVQASVSLGIQPLVADMRAAKTGARFGPPEADGWCRWHLSAATDALSIGRLKIELNPVDLGAEGDAWFDGLVVE